MSRHGTPAAPSPPQPRSSPALCMLQPTVAGGGAEGGPPVAPLRQPPSQPRAPAWGERLLLLLLLQRTCVCPFPCTSLPTRACCGGLTHLLPTPAHRTAPCLLLPTKAPPTPSPPRSCATHTRFCSWSPSCALEGTSNRCCTFQRWAWICALDIASNLPSTSLGKLH